MPAVIVKGPKPGSANSRKSTYCRVVMRNMTGDPQRHGKWEPVSTSGFEVICPSKLEACELIWFIGGRYFPRPDSTMSEEAYLDWLLAHYFRIDQLAGDPPGPFNDEGVCPKKMQVMFSAAIRGWYPDAEDVLTSATTMMAHHALRSRWSGA